MRRRRRRARWPWLGEADGGHPRGRGRGGGGACSSRSAAERAASSSSPSTPVSTVGCETVRANCGLFVHVSGLFGQPPAVGGDARSDHAPRSPSSGSGGISSRVAGEEVYSVSVKGSVT